MFGQYFGYRDSGVRFPNQSRQFRTFSHDACYTHLPFWPHSWSCGKHVLM